MEEENKKKYIVTGIEPDDGQERPEIVYADSEENAVRAYNQYYVNDDIKGEVICELPFIYNKDITPLNGHTMKEAENYLSRVTDYGGGGMYGNIDSAYVLSDLDDRELWHSVDEYLPEDLCFKLLPAYNGGRGYTPSVVCKFDDGTMKFACRVTIDPSNEDEKIEWIEEWSKCQLKNAMSRYNYEQGKSMEVSFMPAYHWQMLKEWANRVVAWRFFKEGEKTRQYM